MNKIKSLIVSFKKMPLGDKIAIILPSLAIVSIIILVLSKRGYVIPLLDIPIMIPFVFFFVISFIGCYFRYPNNKDGKRIWTPSKESVQKARGTGIWAVVLYLVYEIVLKPLSQILRQ